MNNLKPFGKMTFLILLAILSLLFGAYSVAFVIFAIIILSFFNRNSGGGEDCSGNGAGAWF